MSKEAKTDASTPTKRVMVELPLELHTRFKQKCIGAIPPTTMSAQIEKWVEKYVAKEGKNGSK